MIFRLSRPVSCKNQENGSGKQWSLHAPLNRYFPAQVEVLSLSTFSSCFSSTGIGLAHICNSRGYKCIIYMPNTQSHVSLCVLWHCYDLQLSLLQLLQFVFGALIMVSQGAVVCAVLSKQKKNHGFYDDNAHRLTLSTHHHAERQFLPIWSLVFFIEQDTFANFSWIRLGDMFKQIQRSGIGEHGKLKMSINWKKLARVERFSSRCVRVPSPIWFVCAGKDRDFADARRWRQTSSRSAFR